MKRNVGNVSALTREEGKKKAGCQDGTNQTLAIRKMWKDMQRTDTEVLGT